MNNCDFTFTTTTTKSMLVMKILTPTIYYVQMYKEVWISVGYEHIIYVTLTILFWALLLSLLKT
jgi:hypothetical protein